MNKDTEILNPSLLGINKRIQFCSPAIINANGKHSEMKCKFCDSNGIPTHATEDIRANALVRELNKTI